MKKLLFIIGLGGVGYGVYNYFKKQLALALDWDYKLTDIKVNNIDKRKADLLVTISILNKSNFALTVSNYKINVMYEDNLVGIAENNTPFVVNPDTWFGVPANVTINFDDVKSSLGDLGINLLSKKPLILKLNGVINVVYGNINKKVILANKQLVANENLTKSLKLGKAVDNINDLLEKIGIKI